MLLSYPDSAPPFSQATKNRPASSFDVRPDASNFPDFDTSADDFIAGQVVFFWGGGPLEICWRISCQPSLVGSHPKKRLSPKLPRRNAIHLHRTATNTRLPTKPFEAANLFREFLSFWDVNQQKSRTNLEKQFKEKKLNTRARFWVIDLCLAKFLVKLGFTYIKYKTLSATWKIWTSQTWKPLAAAPDCHVLARTWGWKFARREDDECWMLLVLTYHIWLSSRSGLTE